jgi:hypothetical protein
MKRRRKFFLILFGISIVGLPIIGLGWRVAQRPPQTTLNQPLFQGIHYHREFRQSPRPIMIHTIALDLTTPGIQAFVTPGSPASDLRELPARTTSEFLQEFKLQVAVNANFFYPFEEKSPWNYFPHSGDRVNVVGLAMSNGQQYSPPEPGWATLCLMPQRAQITASGKCPLDTQQAVAGSAMIVAAGKPVAVKPGAVDSDTVYARTVAAIDVRGEKLWLIAIDGKQPRYSEGVTLTELAQIAVQQGADTAINLDGGGSTTLVIERATGATVLNSPIHTWIPKRERPVANHLGFYAAPLP